MSATLMLADAVIARLEATEPGDLPEELRDAWHGVGFTGLLDVSAGRNQNRPPYLAVAVLGEDSQTLGSGGDTMPRSLETTLGVVACVSARNDPTGSKGARDDMSRLVAASRRRLGGWMPPGQETALVHRRGRMIDIADGMAWFQDEWTTSARVTAGFEAA